MLKFILLLLLLYLALRLVLKALGNGVFIRYRKGPQGADSEQYASRPPAEEADYEVIETQLKDNDRVI
ncbi:MAG: hypothetical protein FJZ79_02030 [Chlorobi bacterium]|nr:hypothetical protein [Chlorobiota bacterium]